MRLDELRKVELSADEWRRWRRHLLALVAEPPKDATSLTGDELRAALERWLTWNGAILTLAKACEAMTQALEMRDAGGRPYGDKDELPQLLVRRAGEGDKWPSGLRLQWRKQIAEGWTTVPMLLLDATAEPDLLRLSFPHLKLISDSRVKLPAAVQVMQVFDRACAYSTWSPKPEKVDMSERGLERRRSVLAHMRRMADTVDVVSALVGTVGLIVPKALETELERHWAERGHRPDGLVIGHHNGICGSNKFQRVRVLFIVSRASQTPREVEDMAELVRGRRVQRLRAAGRWFERGTRRYLMRDGTARAAPLSESHPDPDVEAVRKQIVDAELDQGDGRGRGIRRTVGTPLLLMKIVPQPSERTEVDRLVSLDEALPFDAIDALAARGVIVPVSNANKKSLEVLAQALGLEWEALRKRLRQRSSPGKITKEDTIRLVIFPGEDHPGGAPQGGRPMAKVAD